MSLTTKTRLYVERVRTAPGEELGRWARFVRFQLHLWRFCAKRLWENNVTAMSAALSFRTIFAMVPAIVLAVLVLKAVGVLEDSRQSLRQFLEGSGFAQIAMVQPDAEDADPSASTPGEVLNVADEIEELVAGVEAKLSFQRLGPVGAVLLIWTALTLLTTIERSLNRIFGARQARPLVRCLLPYWSVLTLGPLVSVAAAYAGRQVVHAFQNTLGVSWVLVIAGWAGPIVVGILVMAAVYKLLPNTTVRYRAAVGGAIVAVPLWLVAKWAFALYVTRLVGTGNLYGALGLLPLFLIWLNLSWLIFLFGAQLAHTAANLSSMRAAEQARELDLGPAGLLAAAITIAKPYLVGEGPVRVEQVAGKLNLPAESARSLLDKLEALKIVCAVEGQPGISYVLARPPDRIPLLEILGVDSRQDSTGPAGAFDPEVAAMVAESWTYARSAVGSFTLADVVGSSPGRT